MLGKGPVSSASISGQRSTGNIFVVTLSAVVTGTVLVRKTVSKVIPVTVAATVLVLTHATRQKIITLSVTSTTTVRKSISKIVRVVVTSTTMAAVTRLYRFLATEAKDVMALFGFPGTLLGYADTEVFHALSEPQEFGTSLDLVRNGMYPVTSESNSFETSKQSAAYRTNPRQRK